MGKHISRIHGNIKPTQTAPSEKNLVVTQHELNQDIQAALYANGSIIMFANKKRTEKKVNKKFKPLARKTAKLKDKVEQKDSSDRADKEQKVNDVDKSYSKKQIADKFFKKNPELKQHLLELLYDRVDSEDSAEALLEKTQALFKDPFLANGALDFLQEARSDIATKVTDARKTLVHKGSNKRRIQAGENTKSSLTKLTYFGAKKPAILKDGQEMRELYEKITGNKVQFKTKEIKQAIAKYSAPQTAKMAPKEPLNQKKGPDLTQARHLFEYLYKKYSYANMPRAIDCLMEMIGSDIKAKGPSIPREELQAALNALKNVQGILGIFDFFTTRMSQLVTSYNNHKVPLNKNISITVLAYTFVIFSGIAYPSVNNLKSLFVQIAQRDNKKEVALLGNVYMEACDKVSPQLFNGDKQRTLLKDTLKKLIGTPDKKMGFKKRKKTT